MSDQEAYAKATLDEKIASILEQRDSLPILLEEVGRRYSSAQVGALGAELRIWELCGLYYKNNKRYKEAISVFLALYRSMLQAQNYKKYVHKAMPLVWISDCFKAMGFHVHSKRYLMLTLCEDAINWNGNIPANTTGVYFRFVWINGLSDVDFRRYAREFWDLYTNSPELGYFPESLLQMVDDHWQTELPTPEEAFFYIINETYVSHLISHIGEKSGKTLERLAAYLLSCMPGCRTKIRQRSQSTDYDVVCSMEGQELDFRSELGRYFVCECKAWKSPANFTTMAKFCRVLDSTKARFGILFSTKGISGSRRTSFAARELLKIYQDRGIVIAVITLRDLENVSKGSNLIWLLKDKYESVRLDLIKNAG